MNASTSPDIIEAFIMADEVETVYKELRDTVKDDFNQIYEKAVTMAAQGQCTCSNCEVKDYTI